MYLRNKCLGSSSSLVNVEKEEVEVESFMMGRAETGIVDNASTVTGIFIDRTGIGTILLSLRSSPKGGGVSQILVMEAYTFITSNIFKCEHISFIVAAIRTIVCLDGSMVVAVDIIYICLNRKDNVFSPILVMYLCQVFLNNFCDKTRIYDTATIICV